MNSKRGLVVATLCLLAAGAVYAKLPAPTLTDEQKAAAEAAKTKAADAAKKDGEWLSKSQDRVATRYIAAQRAKGVTVKPTPIAVAPAPAPAVSPKK